MDERKIKVKRFSNTLSEYGKYLKSIKRQLIDKEMILKIIESINSYEELLASSENLTKLEEDIINLLMKCRGMQMSILSQMSEGYMNKEFYSGIFSFGVKLIELASKIDMPFEQMPKDDEVNKFVFLIREFCRKLIKHIANNPNFLMHLEWRDLERTIAELFNGIGFETFLTPSSKDGGKDIILECQINNVKKSFIVEIKHWKSGQRVGKNAIKEFTQIIINEHRSKGLYLSTYGYAQNYYELLTKNERKRVRFGEKEKIVDLCGTYEKIRNGIYVPIGTLEDLLFENTK